MEPLERFRLVVAGVIVAAWIASLILDATSPTYDPPTALNTAALIVAGFLFGPTLVKSSRKGGDNGG